jgi:Flp pilus assembly protein TadD
LQEAVALYRRALEGEPHFPEACFNLARVLERLGNLKGAREYWRRYLDLDPQGDWACYIKTRLKDPGGDASKDTSPDSPDS